MNETPETVTTDSKLKKPLLVIHNVHIPDCGAPPSYEATLESEEYYGYFQNEHGEQWVFVYDFDTETGVVRGGDAGWESLYVFVDGRAPGLGTSDKEKAWLVACWLTVNAGQKYRDEKRREAGTALKNRPRTAWKTATVEGKSIELSRQAGRCFLDGELLVALFRQSDEAMARVQTEDIQVTITHTDFDRLMGA